MEDKKGIKETTEVLTAFLDLSIELTKLFKDGVKVYDASLVLALFSQPQIQEKIKLAYEGIELVPGELKDIEALEIFSLIPLVTIKVGELVAEIKKK